MTISKRINLTSLALLLVAVAGFAAHHLYEQRLSSGYGSILKAAIAGTTWEERAQLVPKAQVAVRTKKDRETEAKLEKMQWDGSNDNVSPACQKLDPFTNAALARYDYDEFRKTGEALIACNDADEKARQVDAMRLWDELRHTAGLPAN
jgi:hypothetical protein